MVSIRRVSPPQLLPLHVGHIIIVKPEVKIKIMKSLKPKDLDLE